MDIKPLGKLVHVERDEPTQESELIVIPSSNVKSCTGTVLAVGADCECLKVGDKVMFPETAGLTRKVDGTELFLLHENDIFATI